VSNRGISTIACGVAVLGVASIAAIWLIANDVNGKDRASVQIDAIKYSLGFIAAGGAAVALLLNIRRQLVTEFAHDLEIRKQRHVETDAAERRVTEIYTKAVEQLGHADAAVRLGGFYALERVAQDNVGQRQTVVNVICAYLRMPFERGTAEVSSAAESPGSPVVADDPEKARRQDQELQVRMTAQSILTQHLRRPHGIGADSPDAVAPGFHEPFWPAIDVDLKGAALFSIDFRRCNFRTAQFHRAKFFGAVGFGEARFTDVAQFGSVTFQGSAYFSGAVFTDDAFFGNSRFQSAAVFGGTRFLAGALFGATVVSGDALFRSAEFLSHAWFAKATFSDLALFSESLFSDAAYFDRSEFRGAAIFGGTRFMGEITLNDATFHGDVRFDNATVTTVNLSGCRVATRDDRDDVWPAAWTLTPADEYGVLALA
jgi:uncharacterized protein YjbI with pentapeptide repeats